MNAHRVPDAQSDISGDKYRVVILMTSGDVIVDFGVEIIKRIVASTEIEVPAIFVSDEGIGKSQEPLLRRVRRNIRRRGWFTIVVGYYYVLSKLTGSTRSWAYVPNLTRVNLDEFCSGSVHYIDRLHSPESAELISSYKPDLCFHAGHIIIKEPVLSLAKDGVLGYHHGDLTKHRGGLPCFWELYYGENEVGVTTQILSNKLDTGKIVKQRLFKIEKEDTLKSLQYRVHHETTDMALDSILALADPAFSPQTPPGLGQYHNSPTLFEWLVFQYRMFIRRKRWRK